jgi:hypothetical protein
MLKISVVLIIKNGEEYINYLDYQFEKVESFYLGKYTFEYFIYENNSTDNTKVAIRKFFFNKYRKGNFLMEDINNNKNFSNEKSKNRGEYMAFLRNKLKDFHGSLISDYTLLLDCDVIFSCDIIEKMINIFNEYIYNVGPSDKNEKQIILPTNKNIVLSNPINNQEEDWKDKFEVNVIDNILNIKRVDSQDGWGQNLELLIKPLSNIAAVSVFDVCLIESKIKNNEIINYHYYDSLAFITNQNISFLENDNTCLFLNCNRCENHRSYNNIFLDDKFYISSDNINSVNSAFGGFFLLKTEIYNNVNWDSTVCEHHSFCKKIRNFGFILVDPRLKIYHSDKDNYMKNHNLFVNK